MKQIQLSSYSLNTLQPQRIISPQNQSPIITPHHITNNSHYNDDFSSQEPSSIEEQPTPKQLPKIFVSQSSITSRETKKTNDTDSSLLYNSLSSSFDNDNLSPVILDSLIYPSNNLTVNETQINIEKAQMFINKVPINEQNEISPLKIIFNEDNRTMIVMKNIPQQYKPKEVLNILLQNKYINGRFNFFYVPYNERKKENYGFALINFIHPLHIIYFYDLYYKKYPRKYIPKNQKKIDLFYADYYNNDFSESFSCVQKEFVLPNKYYDIFKDIYRKSVCVIKEKNFIGEGVFIVKTIGKII